MVQPVCSSVYRDYLVQPVCSSVYRDLLWYSQCIVLCTHCLQLVCSYVNTVPVCTVCLLCGHALSVMLMLMDICISSDC